MTRIGGKGVDRLGRALFDACVDLNPHQIESALFALRSPLSKGVLLADEVGLGKTIEAGLVLCQYWAERKRHAMVICPASLRKQWELELSEKFNLPALVLDAKTLRDQQKKGSVNPFRNHQIIICSLHFAASKAEEIKQIPWDLVVIDEAHKLRNVYRSSNRMGQRIKWAIGENKKLLLTATPLQNSLLELYGLSTLIDDRIFGDASTFRALYMHQQSDLSNLRDRILPFCWRTLRSQVVEFIQYTERKLITRPFTPSDQEQCLYEDISEFLKRDDNYALPRGQKHLLILLVRKVLASSPHAVAGTLEVLKHRLLGVQQNVEQSPNTELLENEWLDIIDEDLLKEIVEDEEDANIEAEDEKLQKENSLMKIIDPSKLQDEIMELDSYIHRAKSIGVDTKARSLLTALEIGFDQMKSMGAAQKVVIFTESRRTQSWLKDFLESNGYDGKVLTFNGTNKDDMSGEIYRQWIEKNKDTGKASGSKAIDLRTAIIDAFKDAESILITTEAGAEGLNLQFCSMVVNYDLPWNPQRIEQRIGRCHRYGQKYDVVVINFLNEKNHADIRVYELLEQKFQLFSGVFGASDDILGTVESGIDFEKRVLEIYQQCRSSEEIQQAFEQLQLELDEHIQHKLDDTRKILMEHFDEDVHDRLNANLTGAQERLDKMGKMFWNLAQYELGDGASFDEKFLTFLLHDPPSNHFKKGKYSLISKHTDNLSGEYLYRLSHPLGEFLLEKAKSHECDLKELVFDISHHPTRIALVETLKGKSGWLTLTHLSVDAFEKEDYLLFTGIDQEGNNLDQESCEKLFHCFASSNESPPILPEKTIQRLALDNQRHIEATLVKNLVENNRHFVEARDQLDKWADDMELALQKELDDIKGKIRELQRNSRQAVTLEEQKQYQEEIARLEQEKRKKRDRIFTMEDEIADKREHLIQGLEKRMKQKTSAKTLFTLKWKVV